MERSGIYCIINRKNNKRYIGQSVHLSTRVSQHFKELKHNVHPNKYLQQEYNEDGAYFSWEILEIVPHEQLSEREKYWVNYYDTLNIKHGYNIQKITEDRFYTNNKKYNNVNN